jgi:hypothetical protein
MNNAHSEFIEVEARSEESLQQKVASKRAAGWVEDGGPVEVIDYRPGRRAVHYHAQAMFRPEPIRMNWALF